MQCKSFLYFFNKKNYWPIWNIKVSDFNQLLTNDIVSFGQPDPDQAAHSFMQLSQVLPACINHMHILKSSPLMKKTVNISEHGQFRLFLLAE